MNELQMIDCVKNLFKEFIETEDEDYQTILDSISNILAPLSEEQTKYLIERSNIYLRKNLLWNIGYYYLRYLSLIDISKLINVQEKSIDEAAIWLKNNIDKNVYVKYLSLVNKYGTSRQVNQAIDKTLNYLTKHSDIVTIITTYLTLVENRGTERQIQKAIDKSLLYLTNTSEQISSAWQKYLVIIEKYGSLDIRNYSYLL